MKHPCCRDGVSCSDKLDSRLTKKPDVLPNLKFSGDVLLLPSFEEALSEIKRLYSQDPGKGTNYLSCNFHLDHP